MKCPICQDNILASCGKKINGIVTFTIRCSNGHETDLDVKNNPEAKLKYEEDIEKLKSLGFIK